MKLKFATVAAALSLAACSGGGSGEMDYATEAPAAMRAHAPADAFYAEERVQGGAGAPAEPAAEQYIAYTHSLGLSLPKPQVEPLFNAHIDACRAAGPAKCLVTNSNLRKQDEDRVYGDLYLRATEDWIDTFNSTLEQDVATAKGEITARNSTAQDLTSEILDTDARLRAQILLQGRLEELLERRDGKLSDFLEIERELARVTGTIESITANLKALKARVSMSNFTISYQPKISSLAPSQFEPLGNAFGDFFYNLSMALGAVVTAFAVGLPWMLLIGLMIFIWLRAIWPWVRKRRQKKS